MTIAEVAQVEYVAMQIRLDDQARNTPATMPLTVRQIRNYARIAWRAAKAELDNPKPRMVQCGVCQGVDKCDKELHQHVNRPWSK